MTYPFPDQVRQGDTIIWRQPEALTPLNDPIRSTLGWTLVTYVRFPVATGATQASGTTYETGWESSIAAGITSLFPTDQRGSWQSVATLGATSYTIASGSFTVLPSLSAAGAVDSRSPARRALDDCQAAIRAVLAGGGVQEYRIGTRNVKRYTLAELTALESQLKSDVAKEEEAENIAAGRGSGRALYARFT